MGLVSRLIPRMFHRRLVLLGGLFVGASGVLIAQTARLTVVQGGTRTAASEAKLVSTQWLPTLRGRILDRKGRVLAQDRPAFAVTIEYDVLSGAWAEKQARRFARVSNAQQWAALNEAQREALVQSLVPAYQAHVEAGWAALARTAGIERGDLDGKVAAVRAEVERLARSIYERRREQYLREAAARDQLITPEVMARIERQAAAPIREQETPRVVLNSFSDAVGFDLEGLADETAELMPWPGDLSGADVTNTDRVARVPGMRVVDTGDREYPFDTVEVELDRSGLPSPLKAVAEDRAVAGALGIEPETNRQTVKVEGVGIHVLGWMRSTLYAEDRAAREDRLRIDEVFRARALNDEGVDRGAYREGDRAGSSGIEASMEAELRGLRGIRRKQLDTGTVATTAAEPGRDVALTIDAMLQARVQALMEPAVGLAVVQDWHFAAGQAAHETMPVGTTLAGAAVVLDVDTGEVLAMVSSPGFTRRDLVEKPEAVFSEAAQTPFLNRAIAKPYPPGSIAKALVLAGAATSGNYPVGQRIECTGHFLKDRTDVLRCWIYKRSNNTLTHQSTYPDGLNASDALCVSCNIFFFTLGRRLGPEGIAGVYRGFGVGKTWDLGIGMEYGGSLGAYRADGKTDALDAGEAIQMGIGQGPVTWTPLHAANAYATLARMGVEMTPRIRKDAPVKSRDLNLTPGIFPPLMEGLRRSVSEKDGTGHHLTINGKQEPILNVPGVTVWGKTGTAAAADLKVDDDGAGPLPGEVIRSGDHSWYVVLVGHERPRYVISVVMEYAGSGGRVSGPIVNEIVRALVTEGYL